MKTPMGLWIDHRQAIIVALTEDGPETQRIQSKVEKQLRRLGDSPLKGPFDPQQVPADDKQTRMFNKHLDMYYKEVVAQLREAKEILIFGPGLAKRELKERLEKSRLSKRIVGLETAEKMTQRQITAKVRKYFPEP